MLICPKCHGEWPTKYHHCPECGVELVNLPIEEGDQINIRSPKQTVVVNTMPARTVRQAEVECERCGQFNRIGDTFNCRGGCGEKHLCKALHFDKQFQVCDVCAAVRRGDAEQEAGRQAQLQDNLKTLTAQTQRLTAELAQVTAAREAAHGELAQARTHLRQAGEAATAAAIAGQADLSSAQKTLAEWRARAEQAEAKLAQAVRERDARQAELAQAQGKLVAAQAAAERAAVEWQTKAAALEQSLAEWRGRGEKAEARLAEIDRKEREAEAARQAEIARKAEAEAKAEAARRAVEEAQRRGSASVPAPWQRIGIELITIPAGEFLYGEDKQKVNLPAYRIARTPVTNAQYRAFVDATNYRAPGHWSGGQIPQGKENHPVVQVSWNDAQKFCAWAGLRLPTEQEWEKAARGTDGREYPWGAWELGRCNSSEAKIGATTPVDRFPSGASPWGVLDAAGNVWEWCVDDYDNNKGARVLRGGSFFNESQFVRCAFRSRGRPGYRDDIVGFRVVSPGL